LGNPYGTLYMHIGESIGNLGNPYGTLYIHIGESIENLGTTKIDLVY
jgi:hypothetical protein